ncbi:MAG: PAS domain S-box protein [Candidatus Zixiibacteriota bacterium]|nr:MAG: PAS domain S-box protein [candidate division Zixibacteria bacterium]
MKKRRPETDDLRRPHRGDSILNDIEGTASVRDRFELFKLALESLPYPFCLIDAEDYGVKLANSAAGLSRGDRSRKCFAVTHHKDRPCHESGIPCPIEIVKTTGKPAVVEHMHPDRKGNRRYFEVHGYPVFDSDGSVSSIIEYSLDVTQRRLAEQALKESEARWRTLVENAPDTVFMVDHKGTILFVNRCPNGKTPEQLVGRSIFECVPAEHKRMVKETIDRVFRTGRPDRYEFDAKDGPISRWYSTRLGPIKREEKTVAVILMTRDTTDRKRIEKALREVQAQLEFRVEERTEALRKTNEELAREVSVRRETEEALRESEEIHRVLLGQISDAVLITDDQGRFTYVSSGADTIFGYSVNEIMAMEGVDLLLGPGLFVPSDFETSDELPNIKCTIVDKSGRPHTLLVNVKLAAIGKGTTLYTCRDITRLSQAEEALKAVNEELEVERQTLREKNTALKEILGQIEDEKRRMATQLHLNINRMAIPILNALEEKTTHDGEYFVALLRNTLSDITSPFISKLESGFSNLTPRELEICHMIKSGFTSKQIASALNTSPETVLKQRKTIRRKLGISNLKVNLVTHLKSLEHSSLGAS